MNETSNFLHQNEKEDWKFSLLHPVTDSLAARSKYMKIVATTATTTAEKLERIQREVEFASDSLLLWCNNYREL